MLEIEDLHKHYGSFRAVQGVSFRVAAGEIVGFLGPNGAGKTTTMKIVVGYLSMTSGTVTVDGKCVRRDSRAVRECVGYLPEHAPLYDDMTVLEYLRFVAKMRGLSGAKKKERIEHVIGVCALGPKRKAVISTLSKGYRQRVGLGQAIIHDPKLVILDEPTVGLDPNQIVGIRDLLREIGERNTVILSSHILSEVEATCGRVVIIAEGKIAAEGTSAELTGRAKGAQYRLRVGDVAASEVAEVLARNEGIEDLRTLGDSELSFRAEVDGDFTADLAALCQDRGGRILELDARHRSLEDVFRELTARGGVLS